MSSRNIRVQLVLQIPKYRRLKRRSMVAPAWSAPHSLPLRVKQRISLLRLRRARRTGNAWPVALAICRAIGATKSGAIESSCREEALTDLFAQQAIFPTIISVFTEGYKQLKALGCSE